MAFLFKSNFYYTKSSKIMNYTNLINSKSPKSSPSFDSIKELGIQSKKQLQASKGIGLQRDHLIDLSLKASDQNIGESHQSQIQHFGMFREQVSEQNNTNKFEAKTSMQVYQNRNESNNDHCSEIKHKNNKEMITNMSEGEESERFEQEGLIGESSHCMQIPIKQCDEFEERGLEVQEKESMFPEEDYFNYKAENKRQISILTKKITSNSVLQNDQIKELIKLTEAHAQLEQQKQLKQKITEFSIAYRKLKIQSRNTNKSHTQKISKLALMKEQKLEQSISKQKQTVNTLSTKLILLRNYYQAAKRGPDKRVHEYSNERKSPKSQKHIYKTEMSEFLNVEERKKIMERRLNILRNSIESMRRNFKEKQQRIKEEKLCLKKQMEIIKLDILKLQKQNMKFGKIKIKSLNKIKHRQMSAKDINSGRKNSVTYNITVSSKRPKRNHQSHQHMSIRKNLSLKKQVEYRNTYNSPDSKRKLQVREQYFSGGNPNHEY